MTGPFASHFFEILDVLEQNDDLRQEVLERVAEQPMPAKVLQGRGRAAAFRQILENLFDPLQPPHTLDEAYQAAEAALPRAGSPHASSNRVFATGWAERLVRTELSTSYNQAVLEGVLAAGDSHVLVPLSPTSDPDSPCSQHLAGKDHDAAALLRLLVHCYRLGNWLKGPKVPDHPHCTHVVTPLGVA